MIRHKENRTADWPHRIGRANAQSPAACAAGQVQLDGFTCKVGNVNAVAIDHRIARDITDKGQRGRRACAAYAFFPAYLAIVGANHNNFAGRERYDNLTTADRRTCAPFKTTSC